MTISASHRALVAAPPDAVFSALAAQPGPVVALDPGARRVTWAHPTGRGRSTWQVRYDPSTTCGSIVIVTWHLATSRTWQRWLQARLEARRLRRRSVPEVLASLRSPARRA